MRVLCEVEYTDLENDSGRMVEGVVVTCTQCGEATESFGTGAASIRRCCMLLKEACDQRNYYYCEEADGV